MGNPITYYLVKHPRILHFKWDPPHTFGSSPLFLAAAVAFYLVATLTLSRAQIKPLPPSVTKPITAVHSLVLFLLSVVMAVGCTFSVVVSYPPPLLHDAVFCLPDGTRPEGPMFFWAYVFYLSKLLEFGDTALIILSGSTRRLSFLHVYHHATVVGVCYLWLHTQQSLFPVGVVTNSTVHVVMYLYYFLSALGIRPAWKRAVTNCQITQFLFGYFVSARMAYLHLTGSGHPGGRGCSGFMSWCVGLAFGSSLLALFVDFHLKSYKTKSPNTNNKLHTDEKDKAT